MNRANLIASFVTLVMAGASAYAGGNPETIFVEGPTIIGFVPPLTQRELDADPKLRDGTLHAAYVLSTLESCLAYMSPVRHFEATSAVALLVDGRAYDYEFSAKSGESIGVILAQPGVEPLVVYATGELGQFPKRAIEAASDYFAAPPCREWEDVSH